MRVAPMKFYSAAEPRASRDQMAGFHHDSVNCMVIYRPLG